MQQGHFPVINKRGLFTALLLLSVSILLFSLSLARRLGGSSFLWTVPLICSLILFLLCLMVLVSVSPAPPA